MTGQKPKQDEQAAGRDDRPWVARLKRLGELRDSALVAGGGLYILGYAVWSLNAWKNGLGLLPAIDVQYFIAGVAPALIIGAVYFSLKRAVRLSDRIIEWIYAEGEPKGKKKIVRQALIWLVLLPPFLFSLVVIVGDRLWLWLGSWVESVPRWLTFAALIIAIPVWSVLYGITLNLMASSHNVRSRTNRLFRKIMAGYGIVVVGMMMLIIYVMIVYPNLPQALGGIRPRCATLDVDGAKLSPELRRALRGVPPEATGETPEAPATNAPVAQPSPSVFRSKPVDVMYAGEGSVLVRRQSYDPFEINRGDVPERGVVYEVSRGAVLSISWCDKAEAAP